MLLSCVVDAPLVETPLRQSTSIGVLGVVAIAALSGCGSNYRCAGSAIQCESFLPAYCESVAGCTVGDVCQLSAADDPSNSCARQSSRTSCVAPRCEWVSSACQDVCTSIKDSATCLSIHSAEMTNPPVNFLWMCYWVHCHGTPVKKVCSDYPVNACPAELGCSVEKAYAF